MKRNKKQILCLLAAIFLAAGAVEIPAEASEQTRVIYEKTDNSTLRVYWNETMKIAPEKEGYLFGGWYKDAKGTTPIRASEVGKITTAVYAKYVPSYVLTVKAQNAVDVTFESENASVRLLTSVDSTDYAKVGFTVYLNDDTERDVAKLKNVKALVSTEACSSIRADGGTYKPDRVFGSASRFFVTYHLEEITNSEFATRIYVRPYWETLDGTRVEGLGKNIHVEDGLNGYITIPVNIYRAADIAAGHLTVTYDSEKFVYVDFEPGSRLLPQMMVYDDGAGTIDCTGIVSDIEHSVTANTDVYVNLRFRVKEGASVSFADDVFHRFTVNTGDTGFCDHIENLVRLSDYIWDVQY